MSETDYANDYASGRPVVRADKHDIVEDAVRGFNERHGVLGWDATIDWYAWGDYSIHLTRWGKDVATVYDDLDAFEQIESQVDEGFYAEATA